MGYLFLSYRSVEIAFGLKLATDLKEKGIKLWMDRLEIRPADDWVYELSKGLDGCIAIIALISPEYLKSPYCIRELHRADRLNRIIFPVLLKPIGDIELPIELERKQFLDFSDWQNKEAYETQLNALADAILDRFGDMVKIPTLEEIQVIQDDEQEIETQPIMSPPEVIPEVSSVPMTDIEPNTDINILSGILINLRSTQWGESPMAARALRDYISQLHGNYTPVIVQHLIEALSDTQPSVRRSVIEALAGLGAKEASTHLLPLLKDSNASVRLTVVRALAVLGDKEQAEAVIPLLKDGNNMARDIIIQTLGMLRNTMAIPALRPFLSDNEEIIRLCTIEALGKIGDTSALDILIPIITSGNERERWVCAEALGNIKDERAINALKKCLNDTSHPVWEDKRVCDVAIASLENIGTSEAKAIVTEWRKTHISPAKL